MTQHPHAVAGHGRRPTRTATELQYLIRQTFPHHRLWETNERGDQPWRDSATRNVVDDPMVEASSACMLCVRRAVFFDTLAREFLTLIPTGRPEDIRLALRRREQRKMKNKKSNEANILEAQWVRGKALPRGNRGTPWKKDPNDCDHPPNALLQKVNAVMYNERCEHCGNLDRGGAGFRRRR